MSDGVFSFDQVSFSYGPSRPFRGRVAPVFVDFSWRSPAGRTVILGPNGAGKTTLLALAATALAPQSGHISLDGADATTRSGRGTVRRRVGWMPQETRAIPGLTCEEQVAYAGWLKGMRSREARSAAPLALERVGLAAEHTKLTTSLSGGQRRRVGLAQLLVHDADVLLLDEPTAGLDPSQRNRYRELLAELAQDRNVIVSTHQVDDLTDTFETVVVLDHGRIAFQDTVGAFMALAPVSSEHRGEDAYAQLVVPEP